MMESMLAGFGIAICIVTWRYMWMPTALDAARDALFDLRDNKARAWFVERGIPLDHPVYKALRDLINGHLRYTESLSYYHLVSMLVWASKNHEADALRRKQIETRFASDDPELNKLVKDIREQASFIMLGYVVETSILAFSLAVAGAIYMVIKHAICSLGKMLPRPEAIRAPAFRTRLAVALLAITATLGITARSSAQATMEECAFYKSA